ncbi:MAG: hypothetical protein V1755_03395 [Chloroflexota bacterium]
MSHKKPTRQVIGLLLFCTLLAACARLSSAPETQPQHIVDLVDQKLISVSITGVSMDALALHVQSLSSQPLQIEIPAGTYFVAADPSVQNMVARHPASALLDVAEAVDIKLDAACASLHLAEPGSSDTFAMVRTSEVPEVTKVIDKLNSTTVEYPVEQAAIWIVTDDATFDELGMLVGGSRYGSALIKEDEAVRAMMLVEQAGVDIPNYAIWRDRELMLPNVTEPDLVAWLDEKASAAVIEPTSAVGAEPTHAGGGTKISQFAASATASSEFSPTDWSAMQAVGAPDTEGCGDLPTAWSSGHSMPGAKLLLTFDQPVIPTRLVIYETYNPGAVFYIDVIDTAGNPWVVSQEEGPAEPGLSIECPHTMVIDITDVNHLVRAVELNLDQENEAWNQIDAVELIGMAP